MANDTITLELTGDQVPFEEFERAVAGWRAVIEALTADSEAKIEWVIQELHGGSPAGGTLRAIGAETELPKAETVARSWMRVGHALEAGEPIPFPSKRIQEGAERIRAALKNPRIQAITFESAADQAVIQAVERKVEVLYPSIPPSFGAVEGLVRELSDRRRLQSTVYDRITDYPIRCYLQETQVELMRMAWRHLVTVSGTVRRNPVTGQATSVTQVTDIRTMDAPAEGSYQDARGVLPRGPNEPRAEERIRRTRDA